jgi:heme/copper-type cytochrome/quinol oxidase subunit 2
MDDLGVSPNWDFMPPWVQSLLQTAAGTAMMVGLVVLVIALIIAGVGLAFARSQGMHGYGANAKMQLLAALAGAIVVAGAASLVAFFATQAGGQQPDESDSAPVETVIESVA